MCRVIVSADADYMSLRAGGRRRFIYRKMEIVGRRAGVNLGFGLDIWRLKAKIRSEEHTSELQSLMRSSYAVFCLKKKTRLQAQHKKYTRIIFTLIIYKIKRVI